MWLAETGADPENWDRGGRKNCGRMQTMHLLNLNETRGLVFVFHLKYKKKIGAVASFHL